MIAKTARIHTKRSNMKKMPMNSLMSTKVCQSMEYKIGQPSRSESVEEDIIVPSKH